MKKSLLLILLIIFTITLQAQKDTTAIGTIQQNDMFKDAASIYVSIYPVPVRENRFTIKTDRDVSFIRITNIIGQDIFRSKYNTPQQLNRITLENPKRGMYLVSIIFSDGTRVVKRIMVEESE
ncbi:MAG TPA: T9SS type A sorting domain-containing protein [Bacteroidales bacterium]|nr:T9SS type A sorting domain-containing protein [Bacteroidales bacterium]